MNDSLTNQSAVLQLAVQLESINNSTPIYKIEEDLCGFDILFDIDGSSNPQRVIRIDATDLPDSDFRAPFLMEKAIEALESTDRGLIINFEKWIGQPRPSRT